MKLFDVAQELPDLVRLRLPPPVLQVKRTGRLRMFLDMMAASDPVAPVAKRRHHFAEVRKPDILRVGQESLVNLSCRHRVRRQSQPRLDAEEDTPAGGFASTNASA